MKMTNYDTQTCNYCGEVRADMEGWHDCPRAQDAKARIDASIESMKRVAEGKESNQPMTSLQLRDQANRRRDLANYMQAQGLEINPDYGDRDPDAGDE